jgi:transposase
MARNKGRKVAKRPIQRRLTLLERGIAAGLAIGGSNQYEIAKELNCTTKTVRELLKKVEETKKLEDRPRPGQPKKTSNREDRAIKFSSVKDRRLTAKAIALKTSPILVEKKVSVTSVKRRLKEVGLNGRVLRKKPLLSAKNKKARYQWAKDHLDLTVEEWKKVNFSDETPFTLFQWCGTLSVFFRVFNNINIDMLEEYPDVYIVTSW